MTLHELGQELLTADEAIDGDGFHAAATALQRALVEEDVLLRPVERRVGLAALRVITCRALFENVDHAAPRYWAIAARLDDARVELAEALGMTHPGDFTSFNPNQEVSNS